MYSKIYTGAISGIDSLIATVEVDVSTGMPTFEMVGLLNHEVREAKERVKVALKNTGIEIPPKRITVSISPADMRKEGAAYDLPVAVGMLVSLGHLLAERIQDTLIVGELGLDGTVKPVKGILPIVRKAKQEGHKRCIVPLENAKEGAIIKDIQVIGVHNHRSELGILYLNDFNRKAMQKIFAENDLEFTELFQCDVYVYLSNHHPLAGRDKITFEELGDYPCLSFEQGDKNSFYFAEEVFSTLQYKQMIKADDRATMLNLMVGMNGYTLCSGIICEELNGDGYSAIPLETDEKMTIGYIKRKGMHISHIGKSYIEILRGYA